MCKTLGKIFVLLLTGSSEVNMKLSGDLGGSSGDMFSLMPGSEIGGKKKGKKKYNIAAATPKEVTWNSIFYSNNLSQLKV